MSETVEQRKRTKSFVQNECHATISVVETWALNHGLVIEKRRKQNEAISVCGLFCFNTYFGSRVYLQSGFVDHPWLKCCGCCAYKENV